MKYTIITVSTILIAGLFMWSAYNKGTGKTFKNLIALSLSFIVSGFTVRLGMNFVPKLYSFICIAAGIATIFFYLGFLSILNKGLESRYKNITVHSRRFACVLVLIHFWFLLSFAYLYASDFRFINKKVFRKEVRTVLHFPAYVFWFFPK